MKYLQKISLIDISSELIEIVITSSLRQKKSALTTDEIIKFYSDRWEFEECYKYKHLKNFDGTV